MAQKAGIAVETFSALQHAANLSDVSNETLITGLKGLSQELVKTGRGGADLNEELLAIADQFASMSDGAAKTALAVDRFGKAGQNLIPLLNQGSAAIREQIVEARQLGLVIDREFSQQAQDFNDNLTRLNAAWRGLWNIVAQNVVPALVFLTEITVRWVKESGLLVEAANKVALAFTGVGNAAKIARGEGVQLFNLKLGQGLAKQLSGFIGGAVNSGLAALAGTQSSAPLIDPKAVEAAKKLLDDLQNNGRIGAEKLMDDWRKSYTERALILGKGFSDMVEYNAAMEELDRVHNEERNTIAAQGLKARADMEAFYNQGRVEDYITAQTSIDGVNAGTLQGQQDVMRAFSELWTTSLLNVQGALLSFSANVATTFSQGFGNAVASVITGAQTAAQAFKALGQQMLGMLISFIARLAINTVLAIAFQSAFVGASTVAAKSVAAAWAGAATLVSLASWGANAIPASIGITSTFALASGLALAGVAHGGMENVPREGTYLLSAGERVVQPEQNAMLTRFLNNQGGGGGGRGPIHITVMMDGRPILDTVAEASRDGRLIIDARSVT